MYCTTYYILHNTCHACFIARVGFHCRVVQGRWGNQLSMKPPERCSIAADSSLINPTQINLHTWRLLTNTKKEEENIKFRANGCTSRGLIWQDNSYFGVKCPRHVSIKQACDGKVVCSEALHFVIAILSSPSGQSFRSGRAPGATGVFGPGKMSSPGGTPVVPTRERTAVLESSLGLPLTFPQCPSWPG